MRSRRRGDSEKDGPPIWRMVEEIADLWALREEGESPLSARRNPKKLAMLTEVGL